MLSLRCVLLFAAANLWTIGAFAQAAPQQGGEIYGIALDGKLDNGADSYSLGVSDLEHFRRKGKIWYRFTIHGDDGKTVTVEQQSNRFARIRRAEVEATSRPIVRLKICLAGHVAETDFTLTDRSKQRTPLLIGRRLLASRILVDCERTHVFPKCDNRK